MNARLQIPTYSCSLNIVVVVAAAAAVVAAAAAVAVLLDSYTCREGVGLWTSDYKSLLEK